MLLKSARDKDSFFYREQVSSPGGRYEIVGFGAHPFVLTLTHGGEGP